MGLDPVVFEMGLDPVFEMGLDPVVFEMGLDPVDRPRRKTSLYLQSSTIFVFVFCFLFSFFFWELMSMHR